MYSYQQQHTNTMRYIQILVFINGIYDILCAISILLHQQTIQIKIPVLCELHIKMFIPNQTPIFERFLAYWNFTYGMIRISNHSLLISYSYYLEAIFLFNECFNDTVNKNKTLFVIVSSLLLGFITSIQ